LPDDFSDVSGINGALRFDQKAYGLAPDVQIDAGVVAVVAPGRLFPQTEFGMSLGQTSEGL